MAESGLMTLEDVIDLMKLQKEVKTNARVLYVDEEDYLASLEETKNKEGNSVGIDLRLGSEVFLSTKELPIKLGNNNEYITIKPGEFALLTTYEKLDLPRDLFAFISMRFRYKLKGLINISGFHVDPGYRGRIIYSVYNAGPNRIVLRYKEAIFMIVFSKLAKEVAPRKDSPFQDVDYLKSDQIAGLVGEPISLPGLHRRVRKLEILEKLVYAVIAGLIGVALAVVFR